VRQYGPGHPLVLSHIPKTAGTSLRVSLERALRPEVSVTGVDTSLAGRYDALEGTAARARALIYERPEDLPADATLVSGHICPWTTMTRYPGADHITVLRSPQVRILSLFMHARSYTELRLRHWGPAADAIRAGWLPLADYLQHTAVAPSVDNTITRFLVHPHPLLQPDAFIGEAEEQELVSAAIARIDEMAFASVAECPTFFEDLGAWLGCELESVRTNERTSVPPRNRLDLDVALDAPTRELLHQRSRLDDEVWRHVARTVLPGADHDQVLADAMDGALSRYRTLLSAPDERSLLRRTAARVYDLRARYLPGRPSNVR
jgi:hypothetical protein